MTTENIIQAIKMLKSEFNSRYGVYPNICRIGKSLIEVIMRECNIESLKNNTEIKILCEMEVEVDFCRDYIIQLGYFSEVCCVDMEVE